MRRRPGEMPEWSIGAVSKTVVRFAYRGFESLSLRYIRVNNLKIRLLALFLKIHRHVVDTIFKGYELGIF